MEQTGIMVKFPAFHPKKQLAGVKALAKALSKKEGRVVSSGEVIRNAVAEYLQRHKV